MAMEKPGILIVDDDAAVRAGLQRVLEADGYRVGIAPTGSDALRRVEEEPFDVLLLDLRIPAPGGMSVLRDVRKARPEIEVIVVTGHPSIENAKEAMRLGAFDYVTKPFDPQGISFTVARALAHKPTGREGGEPHA